MNPALHVQIIRTHWTKRSRGATPATSRARVPLWLPVEPKFVKRGQLSAQIIDCDEARAFELKYWAPEFKSLKELPFESGAFSLFWDGQTARTKWHWKNVGAPTPKIFDERAGQIEVPPDSWVRLRWHGRFSDQDTGKWSYEQTVVNIARCDAELNVDFAGEPSRLFEWLPQLR